MPSFRDLLKTPNALIGTVIALPAPEAAELAALCGFDWLWLDMEHGMLDVTGVQRAAMAAGETPCLARVPVNEEAWIKRVLDTGVAGLIIPQVNTAEMAQRAVSLTRYPPLGRRSVGLARSAGYGRSFDHYIASANSDLALFVQIEHIQAVENLESILDVPGVDGVIIGPYDLSAGMGKTGQVDDPQVTAQIAHIRETCQRRAVPLGIFAADTAAGLRARQDGFKLINIGTDFSMLGSAWSAARAAFNL